jgi:hypothetical protein
MRPVNGLAIDPAQPGFLLGVNLPWQVYGCDFGANAWQPGGGVARPERLEALREAFATLSARGLRWVRWFMLCDGRAGLRVSPGGLPEGLDERFFADADAAVALAAEHGLRLMFVLLNFDWLGQARWVDGVQIRGRGDILKLPKRRAALLETVIEPILERYGRHPAVWAWDVINEPEWATRFGGLGAKGDSLPASAATMRELILDVVAAVRRHTDHRVTAGLVSARGLDLVRGVDLDFFQLHWYDSVQDQVPLDDPVATLGLDRPVLMGEFPTVGSARPARAIVEAAHRGGYAGALAWSLLASDTASDPARSQVALAGLAGDWGPPSSGRA